MLLLSLAEASVDFMQSSILKFPMPVSIDSMIFTVSSTRAKLANKLKSIPSCRTVVHNWSSNHQPFPGGKSTFNTLLGIFLNLTSSHKPTILPSCNT